MAPTKFSHRKRSVHDDHQKYQANIISLLYDSLADMAAKIRSAFDPAPPAGGFVLYKGPEERLRAIEYCWAGDFSDCTAEILSSNPELSQVLECRTSSSYVQRSLYDDDSDAKRSTRLNYLAGIIARNRSQSFLPKHQLLMACESKHKLCNRVLWQHWSSIRALPSFTWTEDFVEEALRYDPGCRYPVLDWVSASVFDNYTEQMNYSATHNADTQGRRLDMTNWATLFLPRASLPEDEVSLTKHRDARDCGRRSHPLHVQARVQQVLSSRPLPSASSRHRQQPGTALAGFVRKDGCRLFL
eukprot:scaffold2568_cov118-Isochrysis_galbana.AAC.2